MMPRKMGRTPMRAFGHLVRETKATWRPWELHRADRRGVTCLHGLAAKAGHSTGPDVLQERIHGFVAHGAAPLQITRLGEWC
jgi:hypothetical protein